MLVLLGCCVVSETIQKAFLIFGGIRSNWCLIISTDNRIMADTANQQDSQHDLPYCTGNSSQSFEITIDLMHNFSLCSVTANDQHPISRHDKEKSWVKG